MLKDKYGIRVLSALEPIAEDEGGEFYEMFLDWNAEKYSKRLSKRVKDGLDTSCANGTFCGGTLIYGYRKRLDPIPGKPNRFITYIEIEPEEAEIMKLVFESYAKGMSKKEIAEMLNRKGYRFRGKPITAKTFDHYMINRKYTGVFEFGGRHCDNMYPPIISTEVFEQVQKRLNANRYFAGGMGKAREPYLLTGKLFCGHCGTDMVADGGTSKTGAQHHYYICKKKRSGKCDKRRENKDAIEWYVTKCVMEFLSKKSNAEIVVKDVLAYYEKRKDESTLKSIQTKIANTRKEIDEMAESFIKAKNQLLQEAIEKRMNEYEILLNDLLYQEAQLELERGYQFSAKDLLDFIEVLIMGDANDKLYQKKIIDNLVSQVYVSDTDTTVYLNIKGGKNIENVPFDEHYQALKEAKKVQMRLPLARQKYVDIVDIFFIHFEEREPSK